MSPSSGWHEEAGSVAAAFADSGRQPATACNPPAGCSSSRPHTKPLTQLTCRGIFGGDCQRVGLRGRVVPVLRLLRGRRLQQVGACPVPPSLVVRLHVEVPVHRVRELELQERSRSPAVSAVATGPHLQEEGSEEGVVAFPRERDTWFKDSLQRLVNGTKHCELVAAALETHTLL